MPETTPIARNRLRRALPDLAAAAAAVLVLLSARSSLADHYVVPTGSMQPTVEIGDRVWVNKSAYALRVPFTAQPVLRFEGPARGDVVVLRSPEDGRVLLKRVVAVPGDLVSVSAGRVVLDGEGSPIEPEGADYAETLDGRPHPVRLSSGPGPDLPQVRVPEGRLLVLGDHRGNSHDGRSFGFVSVESVLGRVGGTYLRGGRPHVESFQ